MSEDRGEWDPNWDFRQKAHGKSCLTPSKASTNYQANLVEEAMSMGDSKWPDEQADADTHIFTHSTLTCTHAYKQ